MLLEDAGKMGLLPVAEIKTNFFQRISFQNPSVSFAHAMFFEPTCKGGVVMFAKVPLDGAKTDETECRDSLRPIICLAREFCPG